MIDILELSKWFLYVVFFCSDEEDKKPKRLKKKKQPKVIKQPKVNEDIKEESESDDSMEDIVEELRLSDLE